MLKFLQTEFKETENGMYCTIVLKDKKEYAVERALNHIRNTKTHFLKYVSFYPKKEAYTGFCPKSVYGQNLLTGKKRAYREAYAELHGNNLEALADLKDWLKSATKAVDNAIEIEKHDMDGVRYWIRKGDKTK